MLDTDASPASAQRAVALLREAVDALRAVDPTTHTGKDLLDALREIEVEKRRLATVDHALINELTSQGTAHDNGCRDTTAMLILALRIDPGEARRRVHAAAELGPRRGLTGESLPAIFARTAAACAEGALSPSHAQIVTATIDKLPADVAAKQDLRIEEFLVEKARTFSPSDLRTVARRLHDTYDQDGRLATDEDRARRRHITARQHADGTVSGTFHTDAVTGEALLSFWDAAARPVRCDDGSEDPRPQHVRRHDALRDGLLAVLRSGQLPAAGGVTASIIVTMTSEQFAAVASGDMKGSGLVTTGHGALIDAREVRPLLGDAQIQTVVLDKLKRVEAYNTTHRIFNQSQRLAMIARDKGCSMPGCSVPPQWCESHHVVEHTSGGPTTIDNGALLCPYHHRMFEKLGFRCVMLDGTPHWIAPKWIDPDQVPRRNTVHAPEAEI